MQKINQIFLKLSSTWNHGSQVTWYLPDLKQAMTFNTTDKIYFQAFYNFVLSLIKMSNVSNRASLKLKFINFLK